MAIRRAETECRLSFALTRRQLLKGVAGAATGLSQLRGLAHAQMQSVTVAAPADWRSLARLLSGELLQSEAPDFARIAAPWNLRFASVLPGGIARCASPDDVAICLLWAQRNDMPIAIRSGGHSYAGFSTTDGLMIDVSPMNEVGALDGEGRLRLGGGARNANIFAALRAGIMRSPMAAVWASASPA